MNSAERKKTYIHLIFTVGSLLFLYLFLLVASFGSLATDDFHFLDNVNRNSIIEATQHEYQNGNAPYFSTFLVHSFLKVFPLNRVASLFFLFNFVVWLLVTYQLVNLLSKKHILRLRTQRFTSKFLMSLFFIAALFYSSFSINESWFWLCSISTYSLSLAMALLGFTLLLSNKWSLNKYLLLVVSFVYVGGSSGPLALMVLLFLVLLALYLFLHVGGRLYLKQLWPAYLIAFLAVGIAFIILYHGKGNELRSQFFQKISVPEVLVLNVKMTGIIFLKRIPSILGFSMLFGIAIQYYLVRRPIPEKKRSTLIRIIYLTLAFGMLVYIHQLSITYKTQDVAAYRALLPISLYTLVYFTLVFYVLFRSGIFNKAFKKVVFTLCFVLIAGMNAYHLIEQQIKLTKYSRAYTERINYLISHKHRQSTLLVTPLPDSGWLKSAEISGDPNYFANRHLKSGLQLNAEVFRVDASVPTDTP